MNEKIRHQGVVEQIELGHVKVRISQSAACAACKVSKHCSTSEVQHKLIDVRIDHAKHFSIGDFVAVSEDRSTGLRAALYAYVVPLVLMVGALIGVLTVTGNESAAALSSLLVLVAYYAGLYLFRNQVGRQITFEIEKINN